MCSPRFFTSLRERSRPRGAANETEGLSVKVRVFVLPRVLRLPKMKTAGEHQYQSFQTCSPGPQDCMFETTDTDVHLQFSFLASVARGVGQTLEPSLKVLPFRSQLRGGGSARVKT